VGAHERRAGAAAAHRRGGHRRRGRRSRLLHQINLVNILQQSSELSVLVLAESIILIVGKFDLSLESIVGVAPMFAAWLVTGRRVERLGPDDQSLAGRVRDLHRRYRRRRLQRHARRLSRPQCFHCDARDADPAARRHDRHDQRSHPLRPARTASLSRQRFLAERSRVRVVGSGLFTPSARFVLGYSRWGRALYAIGGNAEAARAAGIRVDRYVWTVFTIAGGLAALSGLMLTGRMASVLSGQGQNMIFTVFAACVIGRISLNGGKGSLLGALLGVILLGIISNILTCRTSDLLDIRHLRRDHPAVR
jgi:ribose/xylose/arabinose/galactoside ABC-type transport system permease subunit